MNFIGIQQSQGIAAEGYVPSPLRTGYEQVLSHRTDDLFAYTAKQDGKVIGLDESTITIEYKDGSTKIMEIGRRFGVVAGSTVPHSVVTNLKLGEKFKAGDTIIYNENFFTPDHFNPKQVIWKAGILVKTAILESPDTLEDSSAISERAAQALRTTMTKVRSIRLRFDQTVRNLVKTGQSVDVESILCNIEDSITADNDLFDDESLETLNLLSSQSPKAKANGVVERIEVFYNGDKEDMSDSLRKIVNASDREMLARTKAKSSSGKGYTGRVDNTMRVDGKPLELDQLVINIYITGPVPAGVGDKGVFGNQMKTVFGRVMTGINETESGEPIDAIFGYQSISDRIVNSPIIIGTTNTLLKVLSKKVAKIYRGDKS